jgi:cytochrome c553
MMRDGKRSRIGGTAFGLALAIALWPVASLHAQPTARAPDTIEARLLACAPCHGSQGQGTDNVYFPRLAGKPAGYLMNQLVAFRDVRQQ